MLLIGLGWWRDPGLLDRSLADYATSPGTQASVTLPDGSTAFLDGDSAIDVSMDGPDRDVRLRRGRSIAARAVARPSD